MPAADQELAELTNEVWHWRLGRELFLQLRTGARIEQLPSNALPQIEADAGKAQAFLNRLGAIDAGRLDPDDLVTRDALAQHLDEIALGPTSWWWAFPVTPYQLYWSAIALQQLFMPFRFESAEDTERYLSLTHDLGHAFREAKEKLEQLASRGWVVPKPALPGARTAVDGARAMLAAGLPVVPERLEAVPSVTTFREKLDQLISDEVLPAVSDLGEALGPDYEARAGEAAGLLHLPGGEEAYRGLIRSNLTFDADPEELHRAGLDELDRLTGEMQALRQREGFTGTEEEYRALLEDDPRFHAARPEDVEATYRRHISLIEPVIGDWFSVLPEARYDVQRLDAGLEAGMSYGYYEPPSPELPVGRYRYNGSGLDTRSQLNAAAIIYHELVPGHHFHLARQEESTTLPDFRRHNIGIGVFNEGWAEYAADLARDMGMYEDPFDAYGLMIHQRFTSQRLVVDTGLNQFGWSLEKARATMSRYTMESPTQVATETLRYSTDIPAQALSYRFGCLKLIEFRERAQAALGAAFDIRAFHEAILSQGALPFAVLEQHLDRWATAQKG